MPLERRVPPPRTYQRTYRGNIRQQPYCLAQTENELLEQRSSTRNAEERAPFTRPAKRTSHGTCMCARTREAMQSEGAYTNIGVGNEAEETQRIPEHWTEAGGTQSIWQLDQRVPPEHSSHSNSMTEVRNADSNSLETAAISSTSDTRLSSIIPITVPTPNSSNVSNVSDTSHLSSQSSLLVVECVSLLHVSTSYELSNHDRSSEEGLASRQESLVRVRSGGGARSMPSMPPVSAHVLQVVHRVIKHARHNKTPDERSLWCPDCGRLPLLPVTGQCGHTRCTKCIQERGICPCGTPAPKNLHVNTVIQDLIRKMTSTEPCSRLSIASSGGARSLAAPRPPHNFVPAGLRLRRSSRRLSSRSFLADRPDVPPQLLMTPLARFEHGRRLAAAGRHREAAAHLARVAASPEPHSHLARTLLAQSISVLSAGRDPRRLTRELYRAVRAQSATAWLKPTDLECVLCYHSYTNPVSTPCGHTYCRTCIERSMDYRKSCALCLRSLDHFDLASTRETTFICAALASIDALSSPQPPDPDVIPIFVCTVAYPAIPCPLFIFDPRYWMMIRRVLESGSRKFGMVAYERDRTYSDYGTVLEVCDCVHLEDGRSILSTVGVSRFTVIERDVREGCDVARIQPLTDITPTEELVIWELRIMATQISYKALLWLNSMDRTVKSEIETAFGQLPLFDHRQEDWWESPDGPAWLWWLIAILPLRSEIKILILSTKNLLKRMMAVSRTLEAIDQVTISATARSECELRTALTTTEEWLARTA